MATIRELVTKLTTKADLSGAKKALSAVKKLGQGVLKTDSKTRASSKKTANVKANHAVMAMREQIKSLKKTYKTQTKIDKASLKSTKSKLKAEIKASREAGRAKIKQLRKETRVRRAAARRARGSSGSRSIGMPSAGGVGMGSIISGNVIANAITAGFRSAARAVAEFATNMIGAAANIEKVQAEFGVMLGSGDRALELISQLKKKGAETPLQFKDLAKNARILLQYGSSAENVVEQLAMIGDVVGGDRARFDFMSFAFAQMRSAGKLMGQELRQMVNAGFNPLEQMMKTTGLTMNELRKEMEMGTISSDMVSEAFKQATSTGGRFFNNMAVQAKTFSGRVSTMRDEIFMMQEALGQRLLPGMKRAVNAIINFVKTDGRKIGINLLDSMLPAINAIVRGFERFIKVVFNIDKIGKTLHSKAALGKFFDELAAKIDNGFEQLTLGALRLKEFFAEIKPALGEAFGLMVWGIKTVITNLPLFIKLWAGFKALAILSFVGGLATGIAKVATALLGFAIANPALAVATALLLGMGYAIKEIYDAIEHNKKVEAFRDATKDERQSYNAKQKQIDEELAAATSLNEAHRETFARDPARDKAHDDDLLKRGLHIEKLMKERDTIGASLAKKRNEIFKPTGFMDKITEALKDITGITGGGKAPSSTDALLAKIRGTSVIQNFFIKNDVKTDITNHVPEGGDMARKIGEATGAQIRTQFNNALDEELVKLRGFAAT